MSAVKMSMVRDDSSEAPKPSGPAQPSGAAGELFKKWSFLGEGHLGSAHSCKRAYCVDLRTFTEMLKERRLKVDRSTVLQIFQQAQKQSVRRPDDPRPSGDPTEMYWVEFELAIRKVCGYLKIESIDEEGGCPESIAAADEGGAMQCRNRSRSEVAMGGGCEISPAKHSRSKVTKNSRPEAESIADEAGVDAAAPSTPLKDQAPPGTSAPAARRAPPPVQVDGQLNPTSASPTSKIGASKSERLAGGTPRNKAGSDKALVQAPEHGSNESNNARRAVQIESPAASPTSIGQALRNKPGGAKALVQAPGHGSEESNDARRAVPAESPGQKLGGILQCTSGKRRLKPIAHAVWALLRLNRQVWLRSHEALKLSTAELLRYQTCGGKFRLRDLPMCPLTNFADEVAREEVCEIVPGVFQSNWKGAAKWDSLQTLGITHVVSTLEADGNPFPGDITYLNLVFEDEEDVDPSPHFDAACGFMRVALTSNGGAGKCLVHCAAGVSRSSAITIAFLVREQRFSLREAFTLLRERRPICWPNTGFMRRLIGYEAMYHAGSTSLGIGEYEKWTELNYEAVKLAKVIDRV